MNLPRSGSFAVGQRERLTVRLAGLVRQYQRGPGIIKEFLQNADDAGAVHLRIVMDWRDHGRDLTTASPLRQVLGPALLIANDAEFSDEDFEYIRHIGESGKRVARAKTGRFGLGFNTAYNVTDYPSFLSREWMFCFDPHGDAVSERTEDHGRGFTLTDLRATHPIWLRSFEAAGFDARIGFLRAARSFAYRSAVLKGRRLARSAPRRSTRRHFARSLNRSLKTGRTCFSSRAMSST